MGKSLLDFYKSNVKIDLEVCDEDIGRALNMANKFQGVTGLDFLYEVYSIVVSNLQNYKIFQENGFPEYFKNVSGNKVVEVKRGDYLGVLDLWYPREVCMFNLPQNPIMAGWVISDLLEKMENLEDIISFSDPMRTLDESIEKLVEEVKKTEFYGFWMGDSRNSARKRPIKIRRFGVMKMEVASSKLCRYSPFPSLVLQDKDSKEELVFNSYNLGGWSFYLSKELLSDRLKDLENFWMRGYDTKVKVLDKEVELKKKELENLIRKRKEFENGITEYKKKIHDRLWKSF